MNQFLKLSDSSGSFIGRGRKLYHVSYLPDFAESPSLWSVEADSLFEAYAYALAEHESHPESLLKNLLSNVDDGLDGYEIGDILDVQADVPAPKTAMLFTVIALRPNAQIATFEVTATNALGAFAAAAADHEGVEFVAAVPSWAFTTGLVEFPGSALVDSKTVLQQPEVFSAAS